MWIDCEPSGSIKDRDFIGQIIGFRYQRTSAQTQGNGYGNFKYISNLLSYETSQTSVELFNMYGHQVKATCGFYTAVMLFYILEK
jgi:hypothetical protein